MSATQADDLKPSEQRALDKSIEYVQDALNLIEKENPPYNDESARERPRDFKKAASYLKKAERTFKKFPDTAKAETGMSRVVDLKALLEQKESDFEKSKDQANNQAASDTANLEDKLASKQTQDDVKLMKDLKDIFMTAWQSSPKNSSSETWDANQHTEIWAEQEVNDLVYAIKNSESLFNKVDDLNDQYKDIAKTREGLMVVGVHLRDLLTHSEKFKERLPIINAVLPRAIKTTAQEYRAAYQKEHDNFVAADKVKDKSRMLVMGDPYTWYQTLRLRMKAQIMVYEATELPDLAEMRRIQNEAESYVDEVSKKLLAWQKQQS